MQLKARPRLSRYVTTIVAVIFAGLGPRVAPATAQIPETFTNLEVPPEDDGPVPRGSGRRWTGS